MDKRVFSWSTLIAQIICFFTLAIFSLSAGAEYYLVEDAVPLIPVTCCPKYKKHKKVVYKKHRKKVAHYKPRKKRCAVYKPYRGYRKGYSSVTVYYPRCVTRTCGRWVAPCDGCGGRDYVTFVGGPTSSRGTFIPYEYYESYDMRTADDDVYRYPDMNWGY